MEADSGRKAGIEEWSNVISDLDKQTNRETLAF